MRTRPLCLSFAIGNCRVFIRTDMLSANITIDSPGSAMMALCSASHSDSNSACVRLGLFDSRSVFRARLVCFGPRALFDGIVKLRSATCRAARCTSFMYDPTGDSIASASCSGVLSVLMHTDSHAERTTFNPARERIAILRQRKSKLGRAAHAVAYYLGLCTVYFALELIASLAGGAFNTVLRLPVANLVIGSTMLLLALSTIEVLHFPMLSIDEGKGTGLLPTFVMGAGAGLLSSVCVGPVVVSILVQIATHTGDIEPTIAFSAALKMSAFGAGVGSPLLAIGLLGVALPRGGRWMLYGQWAFGLLIAYFSLGYFTKGLLGFGFSDDAARAILVGAAMVLVAAYARQNAELPTEQRAKVALVTLLGVVGFFVLERALLKQESTAVVAAASSEAAPPLTEKKGPFKWHLDKSAAYTEAAQTGHPVFVDFHGDWCTNCKAFQEQTQNDAQLQAALQRAVLLKVYDSSPLFASYGEDPSFPELRVGLPFFVITDAKGALLYKTSDFTKTDEMALFLSDT